MVHSNPDLFSGTQLSCRDKISVCSDREVLLPTENKNCGCRYLATDQRLTAQGGKQFRSAFSAYLQVFRL